MSKPVGVSEAEMSAAITVGRAMLKGMRATKLPRDAQVRAAIHALIAIGTGHGEDQQPLFRRRV